MSNMGVSDTCELAIVGAGAAGLAAAIFSAEAWETTEVPDIVVLDGAGTLGAKILISGGGRCNVTHDTVTPKDFFGNRHIIKNVLAAFSVPDTIAWFASLGVELKREETGKLFPVTDKSRTVLDALLSRCRALKVDVRTDHHVAAIEQVGPGETGFLLVHKHGTLRAKTIVLATGGRSIPKSGSDGFGYTLVHRLGHSATPTVPALVPLVLEYTMFHKTLSGLSHQVELTTVVDGKHVDRRMGSLLWTHFGISGPVVLDASRFWSLAQAQGVPAELYGNFLPGQTQEQARDWFVCKASANPRRTVLRTLAQHLPHRLVECLCRHAVCDPQQVVAQMPQASRRRLVSSLTRFPFPVTGVRGWNHAEVTAGGVPLEEISYRTMESRVAPGLYLAGEILDCDGRIGGYNFQWAWATGYLAGRGAVRRLTRSGPSSTGVEAPKRMLGA